jgi:tetratricopeptide (TPR) repeat protein
VLNDETILFTTCKTCQHCNVYIIDCMNKLFFLVILFISQIAIAQQAKIDSLIKLLNTDKEDTTKLVHFYNISDLCETIGQYPEGIIFGNKAINLANELIKAGKNTFVTNTAKNYKAKAYNNVGLVYFDQSNYAEALKNHLASLKLRLEIDDKIGIANSYNNIGMVYFDQGNYPLVLKNYFASLRIREQIGDKKGIADSYMNIGNVYYRQANYPETMKNYLASLKIQLALRNDYGIALCYSNIGNVSYKQKNYPEALKNYFSSLKIQTKIGDKLGVAGSYNNIGSVYSSLGNQTEALKNFFVALEMQKALDEKNGIAVSYVSLGFTHLKFNKPTIAKEYLKEGLILSKEIGAKELVRVSYLGLAQVDSLIGDYKSQIVNYKLYILYRDSLDNEETRKKTIQSQMTYDFEKKEAVAAAEHKSELKNQKRIADEKNRKQKLITYFVVGGLGLVLVFAMFVFRSLRITKKQKVVIEKQKIAVEQHQKEIIDSIYYAKRIQTALLPSNKNIEKNIKSLKKA